MSGSQKVVILGSDLASRRAARESRSRPWLNGSQWTDGTDSKTWASWEISIEDEIQWSALNSSRSSPEAEVVEPEYNDLPFALQHACQVYLYNELLGCFHDYFQRNFAEALQSPPCNYQEWDVERVEMQVWVRRYREMSTDRCDGAYIALEACEEVRHITVHRGDICFKILDRAMRLPAMLGDHERVNKFQRLAVVFRKGGDLDNEDQDFETNIVSALEKEPMSPYQALLRIETILEDAFFHHARLIGEPASGDHPQQYELKYWKQRWSSMFLGWEDEKENDGDIDSIVNDRALGLDGKIRSQPLRMLRRRIMEDLQSLRNRLAHRDIRYDEYLCEAGGVAMLCCIFLGDRARALEVEILIERFLTHRTRKEVVQRLLKESENDYGSRRASIVWLAHVEDEMFLPSQLIESETLKAKNVARCANVPVDSCTVSVLSKSPVRPWCPRLTPFLARVLTDVSLVSKMTDTLGLSWALSPCCERTYGTVLQVAVEKFVYDRSTHPAIKARRENLRDQGAPANWIINPREDEGTASEDGTSRGGGEEFYIKVQRLANDWAVNALNTLGNTA